MKPFNCDNFGLGDFDRANYFGFGNCRITNDGTTTTIPGSAGRGFSAGFFDPMQLTAIFALGGVFAGRAKIDDIGF